MKNYLLENVAFQEYEDWKQGLREILDNEPIWESIQDKKLIKELDNMLESELQFIPLIYRFNEGQWEVDVKHAFFNQLPSEAKKTSLEIAEKAIYHMFNFGQGLSRDNRVNRCYKNALTMLNAHIKEFEGTFKQFLKEFNDEQQKENNIAFKIKDRIFFTRIDNLDTIYAKYYGMSKQDKKELEECYVYNNLREMRNCEKEIDKTKLISMGKEILNKDQQERWGRDVETYVHDEDSKKMMLRVLHAVKNLQIGVDAKKIRCNSYNEGQLIFQYSHDKEFLKQILNLNEKFREL